MLVETIALFLGLSLLFYCLFAGADFGAGILEIFRGRSHRKEQQELISHAIGPVWEANHVWLILAVVILFNGFPQAFSALMTVFHIPLTLVLVGIILRGCAFTFRHYDAIYDCSQKYYTVIFTFSSVWTPLFLGVVAGGAFLGRFLLPVPAADFFQTYIATWLNPFCFAVGFFTCTLFGFLASVYLVGEAQTKELRTLFSWRARALNGLAVVMGGLVFLTAHWSGLELIPLFLTDFVSLTAMILATLTLVPLWICLTQRKILLSRILAGAQVFFILAGWCKLQFPFMIGSWTIYNSAAPEATLRYLLYSLIAGSALIFPTLYFLLWVFKLRTSGKIHK